MDTVRCKKLINSANSTLLMTKIEITMNDQSIASSKSSLQHNIERNRAIITYTLFLLQELLDFLNL